MRWRLQTRECRPLQDKQEVGLSGGANACGHLVHGRKGLRAVSASGRKSMIPKLVLGYRGAFALRSIIPSSNVSRLVCCGCQFGTPSLSRAFEARYGYLKKSTNDGGISTFAIFSRHMPPA